VCVPFESDSTLERAARSDERCPQLWAKRLVSIRRTRRERHWPGEATGRGFIPRAARRNGLMISKNHFGSRVRGDARSTVVLASRLDCRGVKKAAQRLLTGPVLPRRSGRERTSRRSRRVVIPVSRSANLARGAPPSRRVGSDVGPTGLRHRRRRSKGVFAWTRGPIHRAPGERTESLVGKPHSFDEGASRREPGSTLRASRPSPSAQKDEPAPQTTARSAGACLHPILQGLRPERRVRVRQAIAPRTGGTPKGQLGRARSIAHRPWSPTRPPPGPRARRARVVSSPPGGVRSQPQGRPRLGRDSKRLIGCTRHPSFAEVEARYLARSGRLEETRGAECRASVGSPTTAEQTRRREATSGVR
jgi:hypothetical protein